MVFSSIVFLCLYLPSVIALYFLCPARFRNLLLFLASLFFYAWGEPVYIFIMLFSTVFDYCNGMLIERFQSRRPAMGRIVLAVSVIGNLGILGFFKYTDFVIKTVNGVTGENIALLDIALPIGISFYTFQTMSYTIDVYRGRVRAQRDLIAFGMYVCMFPQLIAGPIVRYADVADRIHGRTHDLTQCAAGLKRFLLGLGKKVLLANQIGALWSEISVLKSSDMSTALAWLGAAAYTFQIYFDFSGYSDMAIGLGEMFGFRFPENFRYPYESRSVTEFWRRWHMTLSGWFREYVYIPLGGNRRGLPRQALNLFVVWMLTGLWHGAGWNFVLWGFYYFVLLMAEKLAAYAFGHRHETGDNDRPRVGGRILCFCRKACCHGYVLFCVLIGWVIFACEDLRQLKTYLAMLFGVGVPVGNQLALYEYKNYAVFLVILALACKEAPKKLALRLQDWISVHIGRGFSQAVGYCWCALVLFWSMAMLVSGSYNPFLYFRF